MFSFFSFSFGTDFPELRKPKFMTAASTGILGPEPPATPDILTAGRRCGGG